MKFKSVIIGAGGISYFHAPAMIEAGIEIVGVYDILKASAEKFAEKFNTRAVDAMEDVLDEVDMVHLFTPPSKRVEYAARAMNAGKHLFIEKPITVTVEDCNSILECAKKNKVKLIVGFNHRYREGYKMLRDAVLSGTLGEPLNVYSHRFGVGAGFRGRHITGSWRTDPDLVCGMSVESLSHDINMILSLVDGVKRVGAAINCSIPELPAFDNNSNVTLELNNGGIGVINSSWSSDLQYSARGYIGTKGTALIRGDGLWDFSEFVIKTDDMPYVKTYAVGETFAATAHKSYFNIHRHFCECIESDKEPMTNGREGLDALVFSLAILESAKTGRLINL